jgi:hypothetical protein
VIKHLSFQGRPDPRGGLIIFGFQTKVEPLYWRIWLTKNSKKRSRFEKVTTPKGVKN